MKRYYKKAGEPLSDIEKDYIRKSVGRLSITAIHQNLRRGRGMIREFMKEEGILERTPTVSREGLFNVYQEKNWVA
jgi:hypothetical protein